MPTNDRLRSDPLGIDRLVAAHRKENPLPPEAILIERMRTKLAENSDKKDTFLGCDLQYLSMRIAQEKEELVRAVQRGASVEDVWREAADVANFAAMVATKYELEHGSVLEQEGKVDV